MCLRTLPVMTDPFLGSEALAAGVLTPYELRSRFVAVHKDVYLPRDAEMTAVLRAKACWLRSRRRGILAGYSAAALHGAKWIDPTRPAAIIDTNRHAVAGVQTWEERIDDDEIGFVDGIRLTTPARTALDLARRLPLGVAVAAVDALAQATELKMVDVEFLLDRYSGRRGMTAARAALALVDGGAQSTQENLAAVAVAPCRIAGRPNSDRGSQRMGLGGSVFGYGLGGHQSCCGVRR